MRQLRWQILACVLSASLAGGVGKSRLVGAEPDAWAVAKEAAKKAAEEEKIVFDEWNSKEMARSATREIAVVARQNAERTENERLAAAETLAQKTAAANAAREALAKESDAAKKAAMQKALEQAEREVAVARKRLEQRTGTARGAAERLIIDEDVGDRAVYTLVESETKLAQKSGATRAAERVVLVLECQAAQKAAEKAQAECAAAVKRGEGKSGAEKTVADKEVAEKRAAAKAAAAKLSAAQRAIHEADALAAWEAQQWLATQRSTYDQLAAQSGHASRIAKSIAAKENDANRKKALEEFAERTAKNLADAQKNSGSLAARVKEADAQIYPLKAAAVGGLKPLDPQKWDYAKARHLMVRAGFGGTPQEVERLCKMGLYDAVDYLVDFERQPAANVPFDATPPPRPDPLEAKLRGSFVINQVRGQRMAAYNGQLGRLRQWWLRRLVTSPRPLQEKLTLFWHGHFATQNSVVQNSYTTYHQNQLFREHAAGNFGGLLFGLVHDPVMIRYLDNNTNVKGHANENLAREIMELFAMGADQGYTEKDIREAARALTGYSFDPQTGQFRYNKNQHDDGPKTIFGKTGNYSGDDLVNLILEQPATARFISKKLCEYFVYEKPADAAIDSLASVLRAHSYELKPMLKNLFLSEEFYSSKAMGTQIKNPVQLVVGTLRDLGAKEVTDCGALDAALRAMGQELLEPPDVKGWREGRSWINANRMFLRYNSLAELVRSVPQRGRSGVDVVALVQPSGCKTAAEVVDYLVKACLVAPISDEKRQELIQFLGDLPAPDQWTTQRDQINARLQSLLGLLLSIPENQLT